MKGIPPNMASLAFARACRGLARADAPPSGRSSSRLARSSCGRQAHDRDVRAKCRASLMPLAIYEDRARAAEQPGHPSRARGSRRFLGKSFAHVRRERGWKRRACLEGADRAFDFGSPAEVRGTGSALDHFSACQGVSWTHAGLWLRAGHWLRARAPTPCSARAQLHPRPARARAIGTAGACDRAPRQFCKYRDISRVTTGVC